MILVLFGPPGAGKGTQSQFLVEKLHLTHVSTGDLLRAAVKNKTQLGLEAKKFIDAGNLVPDLVVIGLIKEVMAGQSQPKLLLDGFPRTLPQAEALDQLLQEEGIKVDKAVFLQVDEALLKARMTGRRVCSKCGTTYNIASNAPKVSGVCDVCGGAVEHRPDDRPEVIENRLTVYEKNTAPLRDYYKKLGKFVSIDGEGTPEAVFGRITAVLK